ncbi:MAG: putative DNA-binding domain-containing protein [Lysobacterales bacterium]
MNALAQYQRAFAQALREGDPAALRELVAGDAERSRVYLHNHLIGLSEALADIYPVVQALVGADCFAAVARDYVRATPMRSGNVLDYGEGLPNFIARCDSLRALPYLADLALLEWTRHRVIHAPDPEPARQIQLASLAALDDQALGELRLQLIPAARLFVSDYPCLRIWQMHQGEAEPAWVSLDEGSVKCMALRSGLSFRFEALADTELSFLQQLATRPLLAAAEHALGTGQPFDLATTLARWSPCLQHAETRRTT